MRVRDLGTLVVTHHDEERSLVGSRAPGVLAVLLIHANRRVSVDALIDAAWDGAPTRGASSTLESHIWRLRQLLEPARVAGQAPEVLVSDTGGYRLVVGPDSADSLEFEVLHGRVVDLLEAEQGGDALPLADRALGLWRGAPYGELGDRSWAMSAVMRLKEMHGQLQERRIEALLATAACERALSDLEPLLESMPFREPLWAMQMQALERRGRREEALQTYQRARRVFLDEVGSEPGAHLQAVHRQILDAAPSRAGAPAAAAATTVELAAEVRAPRSRPGPTMPLDERAVHLPARPTALVGRARAADQIGTLVLDHPVVSIVGAAGIGKTRLAVEVAAQRSATFVDGVWFVDLSAISGPDLVAEFVVSAIGLTAVAATGPLQLLQDYLASRRVLVLLDNCEHVVAAVAELVEAVCAGPVTGSVLATSRMPLDVDGEVVWTLQPLALPRAGDHRIEESPAVALLLARLRGRDPSLTVDREALQVMAQIARTLDGMPLPLELAAARARSFTLPEIAAQVAADPGSLGRLRRSASDHRATLHATIDWSYVLQSSEEQAAHRRLSALAGTFTCAAARAVLADVATSGVEDLLARLVHCSLLTAGPARRPGGPTAFQQLAPVRAHAAASCTPDEVDTARARRDRWVEELVGRRPALGHVSEIDWYHALDDDRSTVRACLTHLLLDDPQQRGARLAERLTFYWYYRSANVESARWLELARSLRLDPLSDAVLVDLALARVLALRGEIDPARDLIEQSLDRLSDRAEDISADHVVDLGEALLGVSLACWVTETADLCTRAHQRAVELTQPGADRQLQVLTDAVGTTAAFATGDVSTAVRRGEEVYRAAVDADNVMASWVAAGPPTIAALLSQDAAGGTVWSTRLIRHSARLGTGAGGSFVETRATFSAMSGRFLEATRLYAAARTLTRRAGMVWPRRRFTTTLLHRCRAALGEKQFEQAWRDGQDLALDDVIAEL